VKRSYKHGERVRGVIGEPDGGVQGMADKSGHGRTAIEKAELNWFGETRQKRLISGDEARIHKVRGSARVYKSMYDYAAEGRNTNIENERDRGSR
jgi:hypothetical protein